MEGQNTLTGSGSVPSAPYTNNPLDTYKAKAPATSGNIAPYYPYTTSPCPSCGHCPTCGKRTWPNWQGPQWTVTAGGYPSAASANGF
jgi:hypothetical protein